ncbi:MAG: zf-HC2 domain-containing protein [Acidobacteria bacterium]|nr:zf-HC2 domain-containing protein [Acidobacteriota bacterium]
MSKQRTGHPDEEQLLRYADGELAARESAELKSHLDACWDCRAALERVDSAVAGCVYYRKNVLQAHLPPPPAPWRDLTPGFAAIRAEIAAEAPPWWRALWDAIATPRIWIPAVAALAVAAFAIVPEWSKGPTPVQVSVLLRKATAAAAPGPTKPRRLRIRTSQAAEARLVTVPPLFARARYDAADPLSARACLDWSVGLGAAKTESVTGRGEYYGVATHTTASELADALLTLRQENLAPTCGMFTFKDAGWLEITEAPTAGEAEITSSAPLPPSRRDAAPAPPVVEPPPASAATIADELRVLEALHRMGADLGDPVEVVRHGAHVTARGFGPDPRRQTQIELAARQAAPNARVQFAAEGSVAEPPPVSGAALAVRAGASPVEAELERQFGSRQAVGRFTSDVFDRTERIMERAHAIQRLTARFPDARASLGAAELGVYMAIQCDHFRALHAAQRELADLLKPILPGSDVNQSGGVAATTATPAVLFGAARALERSLSMLLGASPLPVGLHAAQLSARIGAESHTLEQTARNWTASVGQ